MWARGGLNITEMFLNADDQRIRKKQKDEEITSEDLYHAQIRRYKHGLIFLNGFESIDFFFYYQYPNTHCFTIFVTINKKKTRCKTQPIRHFLV